MLGKATPDDSKGTIPNMLQAHSGLAGCYMNTGCIFQHPWAMSELQLQRSQDSRPVQAQARARNRGLRTGVFQWFGVQVLQILVSNLSSPISKPCATLDKLLCLSDLRVR